MYRYVWKEKRSSLTVTDYEYRGLFEIKPDQAGTFRAGPPLNLKLQAYRPRGTGKDGEVSPVNVRLEIADCEGRPLNEISTPLGQPAPPKCKITGPDGKTVTTGTFEFG
jgi:hypothetical protein